MTIANRKDALIIAGLGQAGQFGRRLSNIRGTDIPDLRMENSVRAVKASRPDIVEREPGSIGINVEGMKRLDPCLLKNRKRGDHRTSIPRK